MTMGLGQQSTRVDSPFLMVMGMHAIAKNFSCFQLKARFKVSVPHRRFRPVSDRYRPQATRNFRPKSVGFVPIPTETDPKPFFLTDETETETETLNLG